MSALVRYLVDLFDGLRSRPARALGEVVGLAVGWMSVTVSLSIGMELRTLTRRLEHEFGLDVAALLLGGGAQADRALLEQFRAACRDAVWAGLAVRPAEVDSSASPGAPAIVLADEEFFRLGACVMREGRAFDAADLAARQPVAVLTEGASAALGWRVREGRPLRDGRLWTAAGIVAADTGPAAAVLPPAAVLLPWTSWAEPEEAQRVDRVVVRAPDAGRLACAIARATQLLDEPDRAGWPRLWITADLLRERVARWQRAAALASAALGALALLLGAIAMAGRLGSEVRHRTPEIGVRRAIGAMPAHIAALFIGEAVALNLLAAVVGGLLAMGIAAAAGAAGIRLPPPGAAAIALVGGLSLPTAAVVAWLPARRAARIPPAEALREE
ncbi:MAG: ABC transporter permease [Kiritimatiellae bacterium]|nr:ABC transporter permease [Kiritimatiellia bacterium]